MTNLTTYEYDGSDLVGEYNTAGKVLRRYVPGPGADEPALWYEGAGTAGRRWPIADEAGSIIGYTGPTGGSAGTYGYGPFGEPDVWTGLRYRYTGQIMIPEAQLYYYKARVYDPGLGRFLQTDPVGQAGGVNIYAYVGNDPINLSDTTGLEHGPGSDIADLGELVVTAKALELVSFVNLKIRIGLDDFKPIGIGALNFSFKIGKTPLQNGHDYRTRDKVCRRQLTGAEMRDLMSRYAVPNAYEIGNSLGNGEYIVTNQVGIPGGIVNTRFTSGGLVATNVTTPVHVFVGTIVRSFSSSGGATYIDTHGFENAGPDIGAVRDDLNMDLGPRLFNWVDENAAAYAQGHYPGC